MEYTRKHRKTRKKKTLTKVKLGTGARYEEILQLVLVLQFLNLSLSSSSSPGFSKRVSKVGIGTWCCTISVTHGFIDNTNMYRMNNTSLPIAMIALKLHNTFKRQRPHHEQEEKYLQAKIHFVGLPNVYNATATAKVIQWTIELELKLE